MYHYTYNITGSVYHLVLNKSENNGTIILILVRLGCVDATFLHPHFKPGLLFGLSV